MSVDLPLIYACAGCSPAGRAAYEVAQTLSAQGDAEMSCLAGVAAELPKFRKQLADREVWVVDGCPLECARHVFRKLGHDVAHHIRLHEHGVKKQIGLEADGALHHVVDTVRSLQLSPMSTTKCAPTARRTEQSTACRTSSDL
jgi:uncharacterized metal-binding protein